MARRDPGSAGVTSPAYFYVSEVKPPFRAGLLPADRSPIPIPALGTEGRYVTFIRSPRRRAPRPVPRHIPFMQATLATEYVYYSGTAQ